jgi:hypothetical protein
MTLQLLRGMRHIRGDWAGVGIAIGQQTIKKYKIRIDTP